MLYQLFNNSNEKQILPVESSTGIRIALSETVKLFELLPQPVGCGL
jgi:hypothetical protein